MTHDIANRLVDQPQKPPLAASQDGPLYRQLVDFLTREIESGSIKPGERLPTEAELGKRFGYSRTTIRQALALLTSEGKIERFPGRGSFVVDQPDRTSWALKSIIDLVQFEVKTTILSWKLVQPPLRVSVSLQTTEPCYQLQAIRLQNEEPIFFVENYVQPDLGAQLCIKELEERTVVDLLINRLGILVEQANEEIEAGIADEHLARRLGISPGEPVLIQHLEIFDENSRPLQTGTGWWRSDRFKRKYVLKRGS